MRMELITSAAPCKTPLHAHVFLGADAARKERFDLSAVKIGIVDHVFDQDGGDDVAFGEIMLE